MEHSKSLLYTIGLDIGIASVGWAVIENRVGDAGVMVPHRLIHTGVRLFSAAENPKNGSSLAQDRRLARSTRRRLRRRGQRLKQIKHILQQVGLIQQYSDLDRAINFDPYELRARALDTRVTDLELAKIITHIAKRRGFKSTRKDMNLEKEGGNYKKYIDANKARIQQEGCRTVGELLYKSPAFAGVKRNRRGEFIALVTRDMLEHEITTILKKQRELGNDKLTNEVTAKIVQTLMFQRPFASGDDIHKLVGKCTYEKGELRASKYSYSFEVFSLLQKITNTMLYSKDSREEFHIDDRLKPTLVELAKSKNELTYKDVRKALELPDDVVFARFRFKKPNPGKDWEAETFFEMKGYHQLRKAYEKTPFWKSLSQDPEKLDTIIQTLTLYKTDEDIERELARAGIEQEAAAAALTIPHFSKFGHLSLTALRKLIPLLYHMRYDEAVQKLYPDAQTPGERRLMVPKINTEEIRNPVVLRAVTQTRKVLNAIIGKYGSPAFIHIELARDMSKSFKERSKITKQMEENAKRKGQLAAELRELGVGNPSSDLIFRYGLWKSQKNACAYSTRLISISDLLEPNRTQVDHILPISRSLDDSYDNKVLVFTEENQRKQNRTPLEYLHQEYGENSEQVRRYRAWVESLEVSTNGISPRKKDNLLNTTLPEVKLEEYLDRDLVDARYIARYIKNLLEQRLQFAVLPENLKTKTRRVYTFPGFFTARMRHNYGIPKDRGETVRHHAMDAVVLGVSNYSMLQAVSNYYKRKELRLQVNDPNAPKCVEPWPLFRKDAMTRVYSDDMSIYNSEEKLRERYSDGMAVIRPLFVSRMVNRKRTGPAHEETLYSPARIEQGVVYYKKRDPKTRSVEVVEVKPSGFFVNNKRAFVQHASMVRVDVYTKDGKCYLVPVYVADTVRKDWKPRAVVPGKPERLWTEIDNSFSFEFSVYPNDYIIVETSRGSLQEGYFQKFNRASGSLYLLKHDQADREAKIWPYGTSARRITRLEVSILGEKIQR